MHSLWLPRYFDMLDSGKHHLNKNVWVKNLEASKEYWNKHAGSRWQVHHLTEQTNGTRVVRRKAMTHDLSIISGFDQEGS